MKKQPIKGIIELSRISNGSLYRVIHKQEKDFSESLRETK